MSIIVQQDGTIYSLLYICKLLYMFLVVTLPIIRSTYNFTASGTGQTVSATFCYRGEVGTSSFQVIQQDATIYTFLYFCKLPYMFRMVTPPIFRRTYNFIYSVWHWSNHLCYLPLSWESWNFQIPTSPR